MNKPAKRKSQHPSLKDNYHFQYLHITVQKFRYNKKLQREDAFTNNVKKLFLFID